MLSEYFLQSIAASWYVSAWLVVVGLASHYLANSTAVHWKLRSFVVAVLFSPVLLAGANEIYLSLIVWVFISALSIAGLRTATRAPTGSPLKVATTTRFSLGSILFVTTMLAGITAVALRTPALSLRAWGSLLVIGLATSILSVAADALSHSRRSRIVLMVTGVIAVTLIAIPVSYFDWLLMSLYIEMGWPPDMVVFTLGLPGLAPPNLHPEWLWFGVLSIVLAVLVACFSSRSCSRYLARRIVAIVLGALLLPPLMLSLRLLYVPAHATASQGENAYAQVALLAERISKSNFEKSVDLHGGWESIPAATLSRVLEEVAAELDELAEWLQRPIMAPVDYSWDDLPMDDVQNFLTAVRALVARSRMQEGTPAAVSDSIAAVQLGVRTRRGGILVQHMAGMAFSSVGLREIYVQRFAFDDEALAKIPRLLLTLSEEIESIDSILETERTFMVREGWHPHLSILLAEGTGRSSISNVETYMQISWQEKTLFHLLATELAIQSFQREQGRPPMSLDELVPGWLPVVPRDLLALEDSPLKYKIVQGQYILYSIGQDGVDDDGNVNADQVGMLPMSGHVRLDSVYAD